jgi:hypothetical protein
MQQVAPQLDRVVREHVEDLGVVAEARGAKPVDRIHLIQALYVERRPLPAQPGRAGTREHGQIDRVLDRQRRIEDAHFDRAEFGLGPDIPIEILHGFHQTGRAHALEITQEAGPVDHRWHVTTEGKRADYIDTGALESGIDAALER